MYDVFISYASEEKESIVQPMAKKLSGEGLTIWYDDEQMLIGDSILEIINHGLRQSRYGVVVLSRNFLFKGWPMHELSRLAKDKINRILPVLHQLTYEDMARKIPELANKRAVSTKEGLARICQEILQVVRG